MTKSVAGDGALLDAAAKLFRAQGIAGTSVRTIAKAAGMLPGSLTYRYPTKESLLVAMMQRAAERVSSEVLLAI